ncbi:VOC family protein [Chelatococcus sp. XZ-Ab1]|uniref:VOC family protein n=1 Tax=Chelatococcus sp. XZ-Ab1 TaxID=3034027 RepID=UPI0023E43485|nr:VOC family protein [Chelatococcus sp. XZ-Ab1]
MEGRCVTTGGGDDARHLRRKRAGTDNVEAIKTFDAAKLGWSFAPFAIPAGDYFVARVGETFAGDVTGLACGALPEAREPYWFSFISVADVDAAIARALALGGSIMRAAVDVPNVGRVAIVRDPQGAPVGWMTPVG